MMLLTNTLHQTTLFTSNDFAMPEHRGGDHWTILHGDAMRIVPQFEKNVFPLSVVFGYEKNFLNPAITYLKENCSSFGIYVLMPYHVGDLKHQDRIERAGSRIKEELHADSVYSERLPTQMKRGTLIGRIATRDSRYARVYVDFASTTSTFLQILNYKKEKFPELDEDEVILIGG